MKVSSSILQTLNNPHHLHQYTHHGLTWRQNIHGGTNPIQHNTIGHFQRWLQNIRPNGQCLLRYRKREHHKNQERQTQPSQHSFPGRNTSPKGSNRGDQHDK
ncbi:hypothetical protein AVEN_75311-1 [Araneus ventricosus]|uniref:Uncharacterized protein n=1 Tax=Araneus ventricosus TaxID=182803 RepID=A0A4Y2G504_ARAVE|nr:hypothetical protein AVEN_75311-1 [Araneus ventricosus]